MPRAWSLVRVLRIKLNKAAMTEGSATFSVGCAASVQPHGYELRDGVNHLNMQVRLSDLCHPPLNTLAGHITQKAVAFLWRDVEHAEYGQRSLYELDKFYYRGIE